MFLSQGYERKYALGVIQQEKTLRKTVELLRYETLLKKGVTSAHEGGEFIWKPPVSASIGFFFQFSLPLRVKNLILFFPMRTCAGSWLPGPPSAGGGAAAYITYIVTVAPCIRGRSVPAFKVEKRYSEFYNLYCALYDLILIVFPEGMKNPFPDDRFSAWIWACTEERTNERRSQLDAWIKEILMNSDVMTNLSAFNHLRDFLDMKHILDEN